MEQSMQSYGKSLPDQVEKIAAYFDSHLEAIGEIREIYSAHAALEREYATKLQTLARKAAAQKNAKLEQSIAVGNDPTKSWDIKTLKSNTLNAAYDEIINSIVNSAEDHIAMSDALSSKVIEVLRIVERRNEEARKKKTAFFQKLLTDRDRIYGDRLKCKQKYDEDCLEVESFRQKQGRGLDDRHADRAAKQAEQQRVDMLNSKNAYLISIATANQVKGRFYSEDLPHLEDEYQNLQTRLVERVTQILLYCQELQTQHLDTLKSRISNVQNRLNEINPSKDEELFITHNTRPFAEPLDWKFEPCTGHYDTGLMSVDPAPKVFIQNKLRKSREKLQEIQPLIRSKRDETAKLSRQVQGYKPDTSTGSIDDLTDNHLEADHQLTFYLISEHILKAEVDTIVAAVGADLGAQNPHQFKSSSFSIPTQCGYCKSSIWGLTKQGKTCKACGVSVHSKCELKIPANCGCPEEETSSILTRSSTSSTRTSRLSIQAISGPKETAQTASSFAKLPPPEEAPVAESYPTARALFDFPATSEFEIAIQEHEILSVIEPDDGSGWVKVANESGESGLVPATYLAVDSQAGKGASASVGPSQRVRALYSYQSGGAGELTFTEDDILELTSGPTGGKNYGDGWWEATNARGQIGILPSNYVELV